jgi:uncharacterized protein YyaL (SSP411 family)
VVEPPAAGEVDALERARRAMLVAREKRIKPFRDEKILASWNALAISALADAAVALGEPAFLAAAEDAMRFVERDLVVREGARGARVRRLAKDGVVKGAGFLDDHAYVADAALDLYEASGEPGWVELARAIATSLVQHFHDGSGEGFFFVPDDGESILVRAKDPYDHAVPSGASVACRVLVRLGALVDPKLAEPAERAIEALAPSARENPGGMSNTVCLADRLVRGTTDVVLVGPRASDATRELAAAAFRAPIRDRVVAWVDPSDARSVEASAALAEGKPAAATPVAYVCRGRACSLPMSDPGELARALATT